MVTRLIWSNDRSDSRDLHAGGSRSSDDADTPDLGWRILRAGKKERENPQNPTETMLHGALIVYSILRVFHPEIEKRWSVSGIGGSAMARGLTLKRSGDKDVSITVGRDFILQTNEAHLQDRVEVFYAFAVFDFSQH